MRAVSEYNIKFVILSELETDSKFEPLLWEFPMLNEQNFFEDYESFLAAEYEMQAQNYTGAYFTRSIIKIKSGVLRWDLNDWTPFIGKELKTKFPQMIYKLIQSSN